uniref:calcium-dependent protein kinase 1-like n=1 Tax=Styela clava TaxID=7725 RepID=UPI00193A921A|nr:calcium-dependent protein kinase 1-like [Styela clava]
METVKDHRVSALQDVQDKVLRLLGKMGDEFESLEKIQGTETSVARLQQYTSDIHSIIISFGERFSDDVRPIESFQKIEFNELFEEKESFGKLKVDARGGFGMVTYKEFRGQKVAVKFQEMEKNSTFKHEIKTLRTISHDNIISFRGWGEHTDADGTPYIFLVMEHLEKNLMQYVLEQVSDDNKGLSSRITWEISKQIAQALNYLHNLKPSIVHADLKPDNILVDTKLIIPKPKIIDFGHSRHDSLVHSEEQMDQDENSSIDTRKGHKRYRPSEAELEKVQGIEDMKKVDVHGYGLTILFMRTGTSPYPEDQTRELKSARMSSPVKRLKGKIYIRKVTLPDLPDTLLGKLILDCCENAEKRPTFAKILKTYFGKEMKNPFNLAEKGEFFECGFLKDTQIFVADSMVEDTEIKKYKGSESPPGYRREDLICGVEIVNKPYHDKPDDKEELRKKYLEHYRKFCKQAKAKEIDDNPAVALSKVITERSGDEETQKIELEYKEKTYCHHRAMREIWRDFDTPDKVKLLPCLSEVHPLYSTSFGLHVAILTNEGPGNTKKFVFTRRSNKPGMATPGSYTCGAVESCSIKDYLDSEKTKEFIAKRRALREEERNNEVYETAEEREAAETKEQEEREREEQLAYVSLVDTAARGLEEELGLPLQGSDKDAITLNTIYLKFDNHEWGMCGFVDLTNEKIREENRFSFSKLNAAFTSGPKDKFEHWQIHGVDFELRTMVEWIRENHDKLASSAKIVVVKVLQAFFGVADVIDAFERKMS